MSAMDLTLLEAAGSIDGARCVGDAATRLARVHTDTRTLQAGDLFVALRGERFDATQLLAEAAAKGAVAVLCDAEAEQRLAVAGLPGVLVADARLALGQLARGWRQRFNGPLIAVTGSNGKTTVTQMLASILHAWQGAAALATQGNYNNDIGLPLTLLRLRPEHKVAVVELGMNHPGEIAYLAQLAQPTVALVNNAQREHQEFMASVEAVARENGSVLASLGPADCAVLPAGDAHENLWRSLSRAECLLTFGEQSAGAQVFARQASWAVDRWRIEADVAGARIDFELHLAGRHNVRNALAALACAHVAGVPAPAMAQGLSAFRAVAGRSRTVALRLGERTLTLIDDTYNANPDSVRAIVDVLAELPAPRALVLGDMGEVGDQGPAFHAEVGAYARACGIERLFTHGVLARHAAAAFGPAVHCETMDELLPVLRAALPGCGSLGVKGSRFMKMERVVQALEVEHAA